ncbi:DUF309 domain-containing protein [Allobacillus sp. GCM10007491]|uniref:DUF309 domain-containing protein n=1 Tax=Allobacillus saliphilus TaxID=2912308 RepID=A0A941HSU0_9BACI|nr:DUF309 domain-containing protein [Allobacillus saliphilus]MBR7553297.1 DUF309 domain-containing protein [Allobacillus saliphilus]
MYPKQYLEYLYEFHYTRDYFECHEVLEDFWKNETEMKRNSVWTGLIQLAVGLYHYRRGNIIGAKKLIDSCHEKLWEHQDDLVCLGLSNQRLINLISIIQYQIQNNVPYKSVDLPIISEDLQNRLQHLAIQKNNQSEYAYHVSDERIIHRHLKEFRDDL